VLRDHARAEEVVQDSFMKLWRNWARFDAGRGTVKTWVLTTVRNRSVDYLRGRHAHERLEVELPSDARATGLGADPWRYVASLVDRSVLAEALASLPAEQKQAIELAYFQGYRHPEIARLQDVPLSTVKGRLRLGIKKLHLQVKATGLVFDAAHEEIQALIGPYLAGTCENGETEVMDAHLPLCATCRQLARKLSGHYQRKSEPEPSPKGAPARERPTGSKPGPKASPSAA
jgi:RNA polymerase sigma-70 factor (ECF subfamily)